MQKLEGMYITTLNERLVLVNKSEDIRIDIFGDRIQVRTYNADKSVKTNYIYSGTRQ